jgi:cytochrome c oxidase subunit 4
MEEHITSRRTYFLVYLALLVLLGATLLVAYLDLSVFNPILAVGIAIVKAVLVILFFMHVRGSGPLLRVFVLAGFFWLLIMIGLTLTDYLSRA